MVAKWSTIIRTPTNSLTRLPIVTGEDLLDFHQAVLSTLHDADENNPVLLDPAPSSMLPPIHTSHNPLMMHNNEDMARLSEHNEAGQDQLDDEADTGKDGHIRVLLG